MASEDPRASSARPSWLAGPCPHWCTRPHADGDHPEDRIHLDDGTVFVAVLGIVDPTTLQLRQQPTELVVQRRLDASEPVRSAPWVSIHEAEGPMALHLSAESAELLRRALLHIR